MQVEMSSCLSQAKKSFTIRLVFFFYCSSDAELISSFSTFAVTREIISHLQHAEGKAGGFFDYLFFE